MIKVEKTFVKTIMGKVEVWNPKTIEEFLHLTRNNNKGSVDINISTTLMANVCKRIKKLEGEKIWR